MMLRHGQTLAAFAALLALSSPTYAALGGDVSSVSKDQARLKATVRVSSGERFSLHELAAATGTKVREYAGTDGRVFGVAWQGPWRPDLRQLLGDYFDEYQQAARKKRTGLNGPLTSASSRLVIEMSGHPRAFYGRAYVPDLLPPGVQAAEVR